MKFTVERIALVKMLEIITGKRGGERKPVELRQLMAVGARVFAVDNGITAGVEALVLEEGSCRFKRSIFLKILQTYHPRANITIEAGPGSLQMATTTLPVSDYSPSAKAPEKFQEVLLTDGWLAGITSPVRAANVTSDIPPGSNVQRDRGSSRL